ncbi:hypothetical protein O6H91_Y113400 [Diphasiastrum complanatum]|nr:hypothetical protein O6H91_Y113400 [Diphasiastrum complanatum]
MAKQMSLLNYFAFARLFWCVGVNVIIYSSGFLLIHQYELMIVLNHIFHCLCVAIEQKNAMQRLGALRFQYLMFRI